MHGQQVYVCANERTNEEQDGIRLTLELDMSRRGGSGDGREEKTSREGVRSGGGHSLTGRGREVRRACAATREDDAREAKGIREWEAQGGTK